MKMEAERRDVSTSPGTSQAASRPAGAGRGLDGFPSQIQEEPALPLLGLRSLASRTVRIKFCCLSHPVCGALLKLLAN